ncbi:MAG: hypothetical protein IJX39_00290 [Clostridia bacterium]|nr:hypothetical protein [Clostridia bacterium]
MLCRVFHDGTNYVAHAPGRSPYAGVKRRPKKPHELAFRELYRSTLTGTRSVTADGVSFTPGISGKKQAQYIMETLEDTFGAIENWEKFVEEEFAREEHNYYVRKRRFCRKAFLNDWNYFVTFTYSDEKETEESFKRRLRRALSNLHSRRNWYYMGCFERSEIGRLHFHGLFYIPPGQMVGKIREEKSYSTKRRRMQISFINSWFEKRFGRNDFEEITGDDVKRGPTLGYILKYIEKTGERIIYSRGIPTNIVAEISYDQCVCEFFNFVRKWVLFRDWQRINPCTENKLLEGEEAEEWLICFTGYEYEGYSCFSEPDPPPRPTGPYIPSPYLTA